MQIIFTTSKSPAALVIQAFTGCKWHHCGVIVDDLIFEASAFHGVRFTTIEEFKSRGDWLIVNVDGVNEDKSSAFLIEQLGKKYDWLGALSLPFRGDWQDKKRWYCSELVAAASSAGGFKIVRDGLKSVTPRDLFVQNFEITQQS